MNERRLSTLIYVLILVLIFALFYAISQANGQEAQPTQDWRPTSAPTEVPDCPDGWVEIDGKCFEKEEDDGDTCPGGIIIKNSEGDYACYYPEPTLTTPPQPEITPTPENEDFEKCKEKAKSGQVSPYCCLTYPSDEMCKGNDPYPPPATPAIPWLTPTPGTAQPYPAPEVANTKTENHGIIEKAIEVVNSFATTSRNNFVQTFERIIKTFN